MDTERPLALLGGLTPQRFMQRHWQRRPLLVRQAWPGVQPPLAPGRLFELAGSDDVESRLVQHDAARGWRLRHGPLPRRALPPLSRAGWTLLVQGLDLHDEAAHAMLQAFRFVPEARLDDLMVSYASDGGGVGPHIDSYDVFLLQVAGRRHWRIGPVKQPRLEPGLPLKILAGFEPTDEWTLEPGDMLYLPPGWGHDGVAVGGDCMTCSIGFRAPSPTGLLRELLPQLADGLEPGAAEPLYRDAGAAATATPGRVPEALQRFAADALAKALRTPQALERALGETLTEPKPRVWFEPGAALADGQGVRLDRRSRMMYDERHVFLNGEAFAASGRDARLMRQLADERVLSAASLPRLSEGALDLLADWVDAGWLHAQP